MGYSEAWKILEEMVADFRKKGKVVPPQVMDDLKSARTMIRILKADASCSEATQKIEEYLGSVESYLVSEGEKGFGVTYANEWLKRVHDASRKVGMEEKDETRFVPSLPREQQWIRVKPSTELAIDRLKALATDSSVSYRVQDDGSILIFGKKEHILDFVKKTAAKYGLKAER
jgi:hypothetical protein